MPAFTFFNRQFNLRPRTQDFVDRAGISNGSETIVWNGLIRDIESDLVIDEALSNGALFGMSPTCIGAIYHNLMNDTFILANGTAPAFSITGILFDGILQFLKTGIIPNTHLEINNSTVFCYIGNNVQSGGIPWGATQGAGQSYQGRPRSAADIAIFTCYNNTTQMSGTSTNASGYWFHSAIDANSRYIRREGVDIANDDSTTIVGLQPTIEQYIGSRNSSGAANSFVPYEFRTWGQATKGLSKPKADILWGFLQTFNSKIIPGGR